MTSQALAQQRLHRIVPPSIRSRVRKTGCVSRVDTKHAGPSSLQARSGPVAPAGQAVAGRATSLWAPIELSLEGIMLKRGIPAATLAATVLGIAFTFGSDAAFAQAATGRHLVRATGTLKQSVPLGQREQTVVLKMVGDPVAVVRSRAPGKQISESS